MVYQYEYPNLADWFFRHSTSPIAHVVYFLLTMVLVGVVGFFVSLVRSGPAVAGEQTFRTFTGCFWDLVRLSPARIWAIARLVIFDAWRRRAWIVLVLYLIVLLFAGQHLAPTSQDPAKLSISFILSFCTRYLTVFVILILSVFSIPTDFKQKTIYTVATKPLTTTEYVLGRILGFTVLGTISLLVMGLGGYLFLIRTLQHTHELDPELAKAVLRYQVTQELSELQKAKAQGTVSTAQQSREKLLSDLQVELKITADDVKNFVILNSLTGVTTYDSKHFHRVNLDPNPEAENFTEFEFGHRHQILSRRNAKGFLEYYLVEPEELLRARVQHTGELKFKDNTGKETTKGVNVGKEWKHRTYIEGNSPAEAYWTFTDVDPQRYIDGLFIERTLRVFRTEQGNIEQPLSGDLLLRHPETKATSKPFPFKCKDNIIDSQFIPATGLMVRDDRGQDRPASLFEDFVSEKHELQVVIRCNAPRQYFGMSRRDLYLRDPDVSFAWNYIKGMLCIWLQTLIVLSCGVLFSTFVNAPVALLVTIGFLFLGLYSQFVEDVCYSTLDVPPEVRTKPYHGGGPIESFFRIVNQRGEMEQLSDTGLVWLIKKADIPLLYFARAVNRAVPNFDEYNTLSIVGQGFNIPDELVVQLIFKAGYFCFVAFLLGIGFMRLREVAK